MIKRGEYLYCLDDKKNGDKLSVTIGEKYMFHDHCHNGKLSVIRVLVNGAPLAYQMYRFSRKKNGLAVGPVDFSIKIKDNIII